MATGSPSQTAFRVPSSRFGGAWQLLLLSLVFHSVYLGSIFDIYFKSPVTEGVPHRFGVTKEDPAGGGQVGHGLAKRVVLVVGWYKLPYWS